MKITIDTQAKTLKVEQPIKLADFIEEIKTILPDWKEYELTYYDYNVYVPYYPQITQAYPVYPYCDGVVQTFTLNAAP